MGVVAFFGAAVRAAVFLGAAFLAATFFTVLAPALLARDATFFFTLLFVETRGIFAPRSYL